MEIELNPFQQTAPVGTDPVTSITIESNLDWLVIPDVILGPNAIIDLSAADDVAALKVFGTGAGIGVPSMISLVAGHIPNIEIAQVNGLQSALNTVVGSLDGSNETAIEVTNNGSGDYLVTPHFGTSANTLAQGNDTRFSASVTGLRKGAGAGSSDTAAVVGVDYWGTTLVSAGTRGLVPDPVTVTGKFLKDNGTWATPAGSGTVTSVSLTVPASLLSVSGSPVTTSGTLAVTLGTRVKNTIFGGPATGSDAAPTFRAVVYDDVSPVVGTSSTSIAIGNDTRFPASVTGLRKSAGAGSTDTAAVSGVDYAPATVAGGKGPFHSVGLVPDPGSGTAPYVRWLRDDMSWEVFTPDTASLTNAMLDTMATKTLKANATGSTASPTDVSAKTARSSSLLNLESITTNGNSAYSILATDKYVATSATLTIPRVWTLPLANTLNPGQEITISDDFGGVTVVNTISIHRSGADLIQDKSADLVLNSKHASVTLASDGSSSWSVVGMRPSIKKRFFVASATYTTPTGAKALFVEAMGGGGGGAGAVAASSNCAASGGGGGGGYSAALISAPATSYAMIVGSGGAGGTSGNNGTNGVDSSFAGEAVGAGGSGGIVMTSGTAAAGQLGGAGGLFSLGDYGIQGSDGGIGFRASGTFGISGTGGASTLAGSVQGMFAQGAGQLGYRYGGGGSGALSTSASGFAGGAGEQGVIFVTEYY